MSTGLPTARSNPGADLHGGAAGAEDQRASSERSGEVDRTDRPPAVVRPRVKLSILMPVYNEERTLRAVIEEVLSESYPVEIELCVVDDGSTDSTGAILGGIRDPRVRIHSHPRNLGKGAALITAAATATGTHIVPFDADREYVAADLARMLEPILLRRCEIVFGIRVIGRNTRYQTFQQAIGNRGLTLATNLLFNACVSDVHTCLKMMPLALFRGLELRETRFGLDAELTARVLQLGLRPFEVPVTYYSRSVAEGKKITWRDGVRCLGVLMRVRWTAVTLAPMAEEHRLVRPASAIGPAERSPNPTPATEGEAAASI